MFKGSKYEETRGETTTQIAKRIRTHLKTGVALPAGVSVRVISSHSSIIVSVVGMGDERIYLPQDDDDRANFRRQEYTPVAQRLYDQLTAIYTAYNYDDSDIQSDHFDTRFYGRIEFQSDWDAEFSARMKDEKTARAEELKAEKAAAEAAPFTAALTDEGVAVYAKADDRRVTLIKLKPWQVRMAKGSEIVYYLDKFGYDLVRYDRVKRHYVVTRRPLGVAT